MPAHRILLTRKRAASAALALAALALAGFTDNQRQLKIEFPENWTAPVRDQYGNLISHEQPDGGGAFCRAKSTKLANLDDTSQAALNNKYGDKPLDSATWADILQLDPTSIEIQNANVLAVDGRAVQVVTVPLKEDATGRAMTMRVAVQILPGRMISAACFAATANFERMKPLFDQTLASLRPLQP